MSTRAGGRAGTAMIDRRRAVRHARHRRRRTMLLCGVAATATLLGAWWIGTGPVLSLTAVNISGYQQPDQAVVARTVQIAARHGTMLKLPTVAVREALAAYPWVEDVHLSHNWLRSADVTIVQATPVAVALTADGRRILVSSSGRALGVDGRGRELPTYRVPNLTIGAWLRGSAERAPFTVLTSMSPVAARRVRDLRLQNGVLVGRLAHGTELKLGPPTELWAKSRALEAVLRGPKIAEDLAVATYLDVSAPKQPTLGGVPESDAGEASTEGQALPTG